MNQKELIENIASATKLPLATVEKVLKSQATVITNELRKFDGEVTLHHQIGKLKTVITEERQGRNPSTGATITIPEKQVVRFKASKALKDAVN
jgi:DNA-binding protein HU-beta